MGRPPLWSATLHVHAGLQVAVTPEHLLAWPLHAASPAETPPPPPQQPPQGPPTADLLGLDMPAPPPVPQPPAQALPPLPPRPLPATPPARPRLGRRSSSMVPLAAQPPRPVLVIARAAGAPTAPAVSLRTDLPWPPADVCWRVYGVVGVYVLRRATYLVLAAGAKTVGELHGQSIYALTRVVCVPLTAAAATAQAATPTSPVPDDLPDPVAILDAACRRDYADPTSAAAVAAAASAGSRSRTTLALQKMLGTLDKAARTWRGVRGGDSGSVEESASQGDRLRGSELALPADRGARGSGTSTPDPAMLAAQRDAEADARTLRALAHYFEGGDFFFSYGYDLTNCLQRQPRGPAALATPLPERLDRRFWWNAHALSALLVRPELHPFMLPVIQGFVAILTLPVAPAEVPDRMPVTYALLSRRSRFRAGVRYERRGADVTGAVANFVETEQVVARLGAYTSFVMTRGSIPLHWSQPPSSLRPTPVLELTELESAEAMRRHMQEQLQYYGPQHALSLVNQAGREAIVGDTFRRLLAQLQLPAVRFTAYDFHEATRGLHFENVAALIAELEDDLLQQKFCWESSPVPSADWPAVHRALTGRGGPKKGGSSARMATSPMPLPPPPTRPPPPVPNRPLPPLPSRPSAPPASSSASSSSLSRKLASLKASTVVTIKRFATEMQQAAANQGPDDPPTPSHSGRRSSSSRRLSVALQGDVRVVPIERLSEQRGCFRVNCMDCLDRTNVVQSLLARRVLHEQLALLGIGTDEDQRHPAVPGLEAAVTHAWAENGDRISRALKGDYTRTGKRTQLGMMADGVNALTRLYKNNFLDRDRQALIDFLLGNVTVEALVVAEPAGSAAAALAGGDRESFAHMEEDVVRMCRNVVLPHTETYTDGCIVAVWEAAADGTFTAADRVVLLTARAYYVVTYAFGADVVLAYERVRLSEVARALATRAEPLPPQPGGARLGVLERPPGTDDESDAADDDGAALSDLASSASDTDAEGDPSSMDPVPPVAVSSRDTADVLLSAPGSRERSPVPSSAMAPPHGGGLPLLLLPDAADTETTAPSLPARRRSLSMHARHPPSSPTPAPPTAAPGGASGMVLRVAVHYTRAERTVSRAPLADAAAVEGGRGTGTTALGAGRHVFAVALPGVGAGALAERSVAEQEDRLRRLVACVRQGAPPNTVHTDADV